MRRALVALVALAVALALSACRVEVGVGVEVEEDGTGVVRVAVALDEAAAEAVPDLAAQLELDDLRAAGWALSGPAEEGDGRTWLRATKAFAGPAQAAAVLAEVTGRSGPVRGVVLTHERSFLADEWSLRGEVDLTGGLESFSDEALRERLDGVALGVDPAELERRAGAPLAEAVAFRVDVLLPGAAPQRFTPVLGERLALAADGRVGDTRRIALLAVSAAAGTSLLLLLLARLVVRTRAR